MCIRDRDQTDIAITGKGVIDGNGQLWRMVKSMKMTAKQWEKLTQSGGVVAEGGDGPHWFPSEGSYLGHKAVSYTHLLGFEPRMAHCLPPRKGRFLFL